jgi:choline dehydrogenase-like flavoprotein
MSAKIAVVGSGMAGLEAACHLVADDTEVTIFEGGPSVRESHVDWDRNSYDGDDKVPHWRTHNWGDGTGGQRKLLGGRSLFYHGVMLPIEEWALQDWPETWQRRLTDKGGLYDATNQEIKKDFLWFQRLEVLGGLEAFGFKSVPQAVKLRPRGTKVYTPLQEVLRRKREGALQITNGNVESLEQERGSWTIHATGADGERSRYKGYDACVLAASAIGNIAILASSLDTQITTPITDHLSVGAILNVAGDDPLVTAPFPRFWGGYLPDSDVRGNFFIQTLWQPNAADRERQHWRIDISAVLEQDLSHLESKVVAVPTKSGRADVIVEGKLSSDDYVRIDQAKARIYEIAQQVSNPSREIHALDGQDDYEETLASQLQRPLGTMAYYAYPYGGFEHESSTHPIAGRGDFTVTNDLEVQELPGVFMAGPGNFPRAGAANPALTILALSRGLGKIISERY